MPSLDDHFRALREVRPPESWPNLDARRTRPLSAPTLGRRLGAAAIALTVAAGGIVVAVRAFPTDRRIPAPGSPVENGLIAFSRGGHEPGLYVIDPGDADVGRLTSHPSDTDATWSPDGSRIAFVRFDGDGWGLHVMAADGTEVRRLAPAASLVDASDTDPAWSPDGTRVAFSRGGREASAETGEADIYTVSPDGTDLERLTEGPAIEGAPTWSPDGSRIAFVAYDLALGGEPPSPTRLTIMRTDGTGLIEPGVEDVEGPAWSPDGSEIAYVDTDAGSIMGIRPDGSGQRRIVDAAGLVGGAHLVSDVAWSPDGTKLAFAAGPNDGDTHIYVVNRDGSGVTQLTNGRAPDHGPAWQTRSDVADTPRTENVVYLAPYLRGGEGWYTRSSAPAPSRTATVAWASTVPFESEHDAIAIPANTIASLPPDGVVVTALMVPSDHDPALGPFPFDMSGLSLTDARMREPVDEEPSGDYIVLEIDSEPVLIRVYVGDPSPSGRLIARAQEELDTLQLPPICPVQAEGGSGAELSTDHGAPGDDVTVTGPMPFQREDGSYDTSGETRMVVWWNASPDDWPFLSSFSEIQPSPAVRGSALARLGEGGGDTCSFVVPFRVPEVPPGDYPIVVLQEGGDGAAMEASLVFRVT